MSFPVPRLYLGTMTFGWSQTSSKVDIDVATEMMSRFMSFVSSTSDDDVPAPCHIDTARIYAGGKTETIIGSALKKLDGQQQDGPALVISTKAHPSQPKGLSSEGIKDQFKASLDAMGIKSVGEFYVHQPDPENALLDSLLCAHELVSDGMVCVVGMSNYHASEMERAFRLCEENNLTKPTVYQGLYNPLNRSVETELLPVLKKNGCSFVAYNPLAAGLLTGKHMSAKGEVQKGRFKDNPNYLPRFYTDQNFQALELIRNACDKEGISMVEATYRWLLRHSALDEKDGVLLGASSIKQLDQNLSACRAAMEKGPLSDEVLKAFDDAWKLTSAGAFPYWRSYSSDMPGRENLDQGASYSAAKK